MAALVAQYCVWTTPCAETLAEAMADEVAIAPGAIRPYNLWNQNRLRPPVFALWFCIVGISSSLESPLPEMAEDLSHKDDV